MNDNLTVRRVNCIRGASRSNEFTKDDTYKERRSPRWGRHTIKPLLRRDGAIHGFIMASITTRAYIKWADDNIEHTEADVLVLSSHSKAFVDVRLLPKTPGIKGQADCPPSNHFILSDEHVIGVYQLADLEWAFAGRSLTLPQDPDESRSHARWVHEVDSRFADAASVDDHGFIVMLDANTELESGEMVRPDTGAITAYEEKWIIQPSLPVDELGRVIVVVIQLGPVIGAAGHAVRGTVVRVADRCQGIIRAGEAVTVERWRKKEDGWVREIRVGDGFLPCAVTFDPERTNVGSEVRHEGLVWKVTGLDVKAGDSHGEVKS